MMRPASAERGNLSESLCTRLNVYAAAAGAACVGMLTAAAPVSGQVVYRPVHVVLGPGTSYNLDLEHDGATDFVFKDNFFSHAAASLIVSALSFNGVEGTNIYFPAALNRGSRIGSTRKFYRQGTSFFNYLRMASAEQSFERGYFTNVKDRYLGLRFYINNEAHYGWARFTVHVNPNNFRISALLSGYAYESTPNVPIRAGQISGAADDPEFAPASDHAESVLDARSEPGPISQAIPQASLGLLALGAQGIPFWRQRAGAQR